VKICKQRLDDPCRQQAEALVSRHMRELFKRLPMIAGFFLGPDFKVSDLVLSWPCDTGGWDPCGMVMQALVELAEMHPEAVQVMRGRTFARTVQ
jgi:hypothetical protein